MGLIAARVSSDRLIFPSELYVLNASLALISDERGDDEAAELAAKNALVAASRQHSGLQRHPTIGLVASVDDEFGRRVTAIAERPKRGTRGNVKSARPWWRLWDGAGRRKNR
jgi:hypothetical protein